ncbi:Hypothetical predicted protein [Podarcis lilfordi]|uniref:Uncharacterized protein n=1 Tax=Podarcis lilfordi TaxID=74358 RepID=A0AA35KI79_9SAUR|nr:Hypothetical predicted protein [Podarcis lilfordi]
MCEDCEDTTGGHLEDAPALFPHQGRSPSVAPLAFATHALAAPPTVGHTLLSSPQTARRRCRRAAILWRCSVAGAGAQRGERGLSGELVSFLTHFFPVQAPRWRTA